MYGIRHPRQRQPFGPLERLQAEFERGGLHSLPTSAAPTLEVWSEGDDLRLRALIPGVAPDDIEISVQGDVLTLGGGVRDAEPRAGDRWLRRERANGSFTRTLQLPFAIDADGVKARLANGVLELELPRSAAEKPRRIPVQHS